MFDPLMLMMRGVETRGDFDGEGGTARDDFSGDESDFDGDCFDGEEGSLEEVGESGVRTASLA
jgi:hypothetical protein